MPLSARAIYRARTEYRIKAADNAAGFGTLIRGYEDKKKQNER